MLCHSLHQLTCHKKTRSQMYTNIDHKIDTVTLSTWGSMTGGYFPSTGTFMKNGYSIVITRIENDPFSKDIFSNFTPFLHENKEKSELKFTPFFCKLRIFSELLHTFHVKTKQKSGLEFTPFFKSIGIWLVNFIALFKISMRIWIRPLIWWFHGSC